MTAKKLITFELNEVPDRVIDDYIKRHPTSHWATIIQRSARFHASTPDTIQLHPKISWQTFHRGVADNQHGFVEYNQVDAPGKASYPPIWELFRQEGKRIGCGASIGAYPMPESTDNIDFYLTDPFAPSPETKPHYLSVFQRLNTAAVARCSRNVKSGGFALRQAAEFVLNLPRLGITPSTCLAVARQLINERRNSARIVRRRNIQARLTFDVAFRQLVRCEPDFTTLFANHVAASMHRYWAAAYPHDYQNNNMPADWRETYRHEIDTAMHETDYMLGRLLNFVKRRPEYSVVVVGSMGQAAIEHEVVHNQLVVDDMPRFMAMFGLTPDDYTRLPGMEPEYVIEFADAARCANFAKAGEQLDIDGARMLVKPVNETQNTFLVFQNNIDIDHVMFGGESVSLGDAGLHIEPINDLSGSTAQHTRNGCCFAFHGARDLSSDSDMKNPFCLTAVTASLLSAQGVTVPDYMPAPIEALVRVLGNPTRMTRFAPDSNTASSRSGAAHIAP